MRLQEIWTLISSQHRSQQVPWHLDERLKPVAHLASSEALRSAPMSTSLSLTLGEARDEANDMPKATTVFETR